jgi:hypothetical protein
MFTTDVSVKCPKCGTKFNSRRVPNVPDTGVRDSELRYIPPAIDQKYEGFAVCTCPSCGVSDWAYTFEKINEQVFVQQSQMPPHLQYRTAAMTAEREGRNSFNIALLYLYAAWCADDIMALPQAREYRRKAADYFRRSLIDRSCPFPELMSVEYLIGELLRRASQFQDSVNHLHAQMPKFSPRFASMAEKVMQLAMMQNSEPMPLDVSPGG